MMAAGFSYKNSKITCESWSQRMDAVIRTSEMKGPQLLEFLSCT